jgi:hypothetical protein
VPWLKTVIKHEAFALRRQRERLTPVTGDGEPVERGTVPTATHEQAERYERLSQSAEALRRLKPQEIRCLVLRAKGLSYREICDVTGFTYTKVNRCLTEGRQALSGRLAGIESGAECARLAPLLSALADGEADAAALARLRPHLKTCLSCRARLREFRAAPARVAALVPTALVAGPGGGLRGFAESALGALQQKIDALLAATHHKAAALGERAQTAAELVTGQKLAAVAASAAALAGGGTAVDHLANHHGPPRHAVATQQQQDQAPPAEQQPAAPPPSSPPLTTEQPTTPEQSRAAPVEAPPPPPPPDPANEFEANAASAARAVEPHAPSTAASPPVAAAGPAAGGVPRAAPASPAASEFGP